MPAITQEEFAKLAHLCKIHCSSEEQKFITVNLEKILSYASQLDSLDMTTTPPCYQVTPAEPNFTRQDEIETTLSREEFLANAPQHIGGMIKVPPILNTST